MEVSEWIAYMNLRARREKEIADENAEKAKKRAKENNQ